MPAKLYHILSALSLAIHTCSFGPSSVTAASVHIRGHDLFHHPPAHVLLANGKRSKNCCKSSRTSSKNLSPKPGSRHIVPSSISPSGKVGLAWAVNDNVALTHFVTPHVGVIMTWSPWYPENAKSLGLRPCPMLWGPKQLDDFIKLVKPGYADCVMGFNEPNHDGQSDLDPYYAAHLWKQYIQPLKSQGYTLISPACTNAPSGKTWMQRFMQACDGCTFDGLAVHFYGTDPRDMIKHLQDMHNHFNIPIWPTEFACQNFAGGDQCDMGQVWNFMKTVKNFMDNTEWVPHYFAFGTLYDMANVNPNNQLLGADRYPTPLGQFYIS